MSAAKKVILPSLVKKYLMAGSGIILVLFVLGHMLGNLQFFGPPEMINAYAYHLHHLPGAPVTLWLIRAFLLACVVVHIAMAVLLVKENREARPQNYAKQGFRDSDYAARTMPMSGLIILAFIVFHILQYTVRVVPEHYNATIGQAPVEVAHQHLEYFDVFAMMVKGFSSPIVSIFYIIAVGLLCVHLTHGVTSMFQSLGVRNELWRGRLKCLASAYGLFVFIGFASIPASVLFFGHGKSYLAEKEAEWAAAPAAEVSVNDAPGANTQFVTLNEGR
ncbi:MAG: succinate dehydrogenase cytochrome b subunit [Puniceicoccales bacterium]